MSHRLEEIRNEQIVPLNQTDHSEGGNHSFQSFSENPTQKVHPELLQMIVGLNQRLANQSTTIGQLERKQLSSNQLIDRLTSGSDTTVAMPSAPQADSVDAIMSYPVVSYNEAQQILTNRTFPAQGLPSRNVLKK